jgi:hypothetical protein
MAPRCAKARAQALPTCISPASAAKTVINATRKTVTSFPEPATRMSKTMATGWPRVWVSTAWVKPFCNDQPEPKRCSICAGWSSTITDLPARVIQNERHVTVGSRSADALRPTRSLGSNSASGRHDLGPVLGKLRNNRGIQVQRFGDHLRWTMRQPIGQRDLLEPLGPEDLHEDQVRVASVLDVMA